MKQSEPTIDLLMRTPIISSDKEVFTNKRDFINHCLEVMGHQYGVEVESETFMGGNLWKMTYHSRFGKHVWASTFVNEQELWDRAEREALYTLESLNSNRSYDTKHTLEDVIASAKASGEDASYWQDLLDTLNEVAA